MIGCHARALSRDIKIDTNELEDARWFSRDETVAMLLRQHPDLRNPTTGVVVGRRFLFVADPNLQVFADGALSAALAGREGSTFDRAVARGVALTPAQHEQLLELAQTLLAPSGSARVLTRDQERAIRLLLRSDRKLDTRNPWLGQAY
jgi:hypothetical protein